MPRTWLWYAAYMAPDISLFDPRFLCRGWFHTQVCYSIHMPLDMEMLFNLIAFVCDLVDCRRQKMRRTLPLSKASQ